MIRFSTLIPIGAGASSKVYKALDPDSGRWLAIKYLLQADDAARLRLMREARAVASLNHPHVCPILEVGEEQGRPYILMPYLDGVDLAQSLGDLTLEARLRLIAQVADAVQHAHEHGLLHRDLKPENIVVTHEHGLPHAWVLDFGLVRELDQPGITATGQILGTPAFMSPEQARGSALDRRSDVFSLGAVLYFALVARAPFSGPSTAETLASVMHADPPRLRKLRRDLPPALQAIVATAMAKSPARRYSSAQALADDLRLFLSGRRPLAREHRFDALARLYRRQPWLVWLLGTGVLAALVVLMLWLYWSARANEQVRVAHERAVATEAARQSLRLEYLRPIHDLQEVLVSTRSLAEQMAQRASRSTGHQAEADWLAVAQLRADMDDLPQALEASAAALALGDDEELRRQHAALLLRAYRAGLSEPQPYSDPVLREALRSSVANRYLQPAQRILESLAESDRERIAATAANADPAAFAAAVASLEQAFAQDPRRYELLLQAAELRIQRGIEQHWNNAFAPAEVEFAAADALLLRALEHGRSDPRLHRKRCELAMVWVDARGASAASGASASPPDAACDTALHVRPDDAVLLRMLAHLNTGRARQMRSRGEDGSPLLRKAISSAEHALRLAPQDVRAARVLALALMRLSTQQRWLGAVDPAVIERAAQVLAAAPESSVEHPVDLDLIRSQVDVETAKVLEHLGQDPSAAYQRAITRWREVAARLPQAMFLKVYLANVLGSYQYWLAVQGRPDGALVEEGISALREVVAQEPERATAWSALADSHWDLVMIRSWRGDDASVQIDAADQLYAKATSLDPDNLTILFNTYSFNLFVASEALREGRPAQRRLEAAEQLMGQIDSQSSDWITPCPRAELSLQQVHQAVRSGQLAGTARRRTLELLDAGLLKQADDHDCAVRRVKLATFVLPLLNAEQSRAEFRAAQAATTLHNTLEMDLARLGLLHAASRRADPSLPIDPAEQKRLYERIAAVTQGAWSARLRAYVHPTGD